MGRGQEGQRGDGSVGPVTEAPTLTPDAQLLCGPLRSARYRRHECVCVVAGQFRYHTCSPLSLTPDAQLLRALVRCEADAQDRPHHPPVLNDLLHAALDDVDGDRKAHAAVGARGGVDGGVDADQAAARVEQRAATVACRRN